VLLHSYVQDDARTMPSCHVIARDVELMGGRRRPRGIAARTCCCCCPSSLFASSPPECAADSAALYDYNCSQSTTIAGEALHCPPIQQSTAVLQLSLSSFRGEVNEDHLRLGMQPRGWQSACRTSALPSKKRYINQWRIQGGPLFLAKSI